jgi:hypothetical protein
MQDFYKFTQDAADWLGFKASRVYNLYTTLKGQPSLQERRKHHLAQYRHPHLLVL